MRKPIGSRPWASQTRQRKPFARGTAARHLRRRDALETDRDAADHDGVAIDHAGSADQLLGCGRLRQEAKERCEQN